MQISPKYKLHPITYLMLIVTVAVAIALLAAPAVSISANQCSSCHGTTYNQQLDILEGNSQNQIPTTIQVGQTQTVQVVVANVNNAPKNDQFSTLSVTLSSQNGRFSVSPSTVTITNMATSTATASWQITGVSSGTDVLSISASAVNSHENLRFTDSYYPSVSINVNAAPTLPPTSPPTPNPTAPSTPQPTTAPTSPPTPTINPTQNPSTPTTPPTLPPNPTTTPTPNPTPTDSTNPPTSTTTPTPTTNPTITPTPTPTTVPTVVQATTNTGTNVDLYINGNITAQQISAVTLNTQPTTTATISFTLTGQTGNVGFANMTISKNSVQVSAAPIIYFDNQIVQNQGYTEDTNNYYVWWTNHFSTNNVSIVFSGSIPIPETPTLAILIAVLAAGFLILTVLTIKRKKQSPFF